MSLTIVVKVLRIAKVCNDLYSGFQQTSHSLNSSRLAIVISSAWKAIRDGLRWLRKVLIRSNSSLYLRTIQIIDIKTVWEWVGSQFAHVVLITSGVDVEHILHFWGTEVVRCWADIIPTSNVTLASLVDAVTNPIEIVVPLCLDGCIVWVIVISVPGIDGEVVVRLILDQGVEPAISDKNVLKVDVDCTRNLLCILLDEVIWWTVSLLLAAVVIFSSIGNTVENRAIVSSITLGGKAKSISGVLWEGTHESLQRFPHIWSSSLSCVGD